MIPLAVNRRGGFLRTLRFDVDRRRTVLRRTGLRRAVLRLTVVFLRAGLRLTVVRFRAGFRLVVLRFTVRRAVFFFRRCLLNATSFAVARRCAGVLAFFRAMRRPFLGLIRKITLEIFP